MKNGGRKGALSINFYSFVYNIQDLEAGKCPPAEKWIKISVVHLHNGLLYCCKKKKITWMYLESTMVKEISQSEKY